MQFSSNIHSLRITTMGVIFTLHSIYRIHYCMAMVSLYVFSEMESNKSDINSIKLSDLANSNTHNVFDSVTHHVQ